MKYGKALVSQVYAGKRQHKDSVFPIRRQDVKLLQALRRVELVADPAEAARPLRDFYMTTALPESPVKKKRGRPKKVKTDDA